MPIFGKPRFGVPYEYGGTPPIAPQFGADIDPMQQPVEGPTNVGKQRGKFDWGEGLAVLGAILGGSSVPLQLRLQQQQQRQRQQQDEAERQARLQDQMTLYDYERNNPKPSSNDTVADYNFWKQILPPEQFQTWLANKIDPPQYRQGPDGQFYRVQTQPTAQEQTLGAQLPSGWQIEGGAPQAPRPFVNPPVRLKHGAMTSGRRTVEGNRAVGGVPNSQHLGGRAADWTGPDLNALLAEVRGLPGNKRAFIHDGNHVHGEGEWNVPYFGKRGTIGKR